jgi:hypothetical protein
MRKAQFSSSFSAAAALVMIASGCGAYNNSGSSYNLKVSKATSVTAVDPTVNAGIGYECQASAVIVPASAPADGRGKYQVCTSKSSLTEIQLQGRSLSSSHICAYPARAVGTAPATAIYDMYGNPISSCVGLSGGASTTTTSFSFPGVTFNALAVIDQTDEFGRSQKERMDQCLRTQMYSDCPTYAYGIFR